MNRPFELNDVDFDSECDENELEVDYDVETDIDIQPITNCWEFILIFLMYPSFFLRLNWKS